MTSEEENWLNETIDELINESSNNNEENNNGNDIPTNSPTLLMEESTQRFSSASWFEETKKYAITIGGVGGINSWSSILLSRLKPFRITLYDPDIIEKVNMAGQFYESKDIGSYKATIIAEKIRSFSDYSMAYSFNRAYTSVGIASSVMISGFDNMRARKTFFTNWRNFVSSHTEEQSKYCLFIDGRLNAEEFQIFCIKGDDTYNIKRYEKEFLFDDSEVEEAVCSYKQTSFCSAMIASMITNLYVNFAANINNPIVERDLPFFTYYDATRMYLRTER